MTWCCHFSNSWAFVARIVWRLDRQWRQLAAVWSLWVRSIWSDATATQWNQRAVCCTGSWHRSLGVTNTRNDRCNLASIHAHNRVSTTISRVNSISQYWSPCPDIDQALAMYRPDAETATQPPSVQLRVYIPLESFPGMAGAELCKTWVYSVISISS